MNGPTVQDQSVDDYKTFIDFTVTLLDVTSSELVFELSINNNPDMEDLYKQFNLVF